MKNAEVKVKSPGEQIIEIPLAELEAVDVSDRNLERMARGFIMGSQAIGRRREIREVLEQKVVKKIGRKGKYLVDKLFELIEGVYVVDKSRNGKGGQEIRYYQVPPSLNAIVYALDRVLGKPKQYTEHSEEKRGIILVEHVIKNLASNPYKNANGVGKNIESGAGRGGVGDVDSRGSESSERVAVGVGQGAV